MLLALSLSFNLLIPLVTFVGIGAVAWLALEMMTGEKARAEQRLDELRDPKRKGGRGDDREQKKTEAIARVLQKASPTLAKPMKMNESQLGKLRQELVEAGFRSESAPTTYLAIRTLCAGVFLFFAGGASLFMYGFTQAAGLRTFVIAAIGFYLPVFVLKFLSSRRKQQIFLGLPDALDLLVVCVEAGLGLDQAMRKVSDEMKKSYRIIAEEFGLCNLHLQMGRARSQVLQDLGARTGVDDLRALASILIQADKFGSSIANALRVQSDAMRVRRQQIAEEKAAKTAVKLIFPLVLFIFPGIFVVLVGPAGIQMARDMFPMMGGGQ